MSCRVIKSVSVTSSGGNTIVNFGTIANFALQNLRDYKFTICQQVPTTTTIEPVQFQINGIAYNILTNSGNNFMADQLTQGVLYCVVYGNNPSHFLVKNCLKPTGFTPTVAATLLNTLTNVTGTPILAETKTSKSK